jgi:phosphatidylserine decarboxylase
VPGLFARNERVVCVFEGDDDRPWVLVLVGATIVGSMATVWHGVVNPPRPGRLREWSYHEQSIRLDPGAEMGRFLLGSTVVMLFPRGPAAVRPGLGAGRAGAHGAGHGPPRVGAWLHRDRPAPGVGRNCCCGRCRRCGRRTTSSRAPPKV